MPRVTKKSVVAAREDHRAPFLFDESNLPLRADVVESVVQKRYEYTGAAITTSDAEALRLVEFLCLGLGIKRIAKAMGFSPHCVRAAKRALEAQGKIEPLKQRFAEKCGEIMEEGATAVLDAITDGRMHPNFIGSTVGIFFDKRQLSIGEATSISVGLTGKLNPDQLSVRTLNNFFAARSTDSESTVSKAKPQQIAIEAELVPSFVPDSSKPNPETAGEATDGPTTPTPRTATEFPRPPPGQDGGGGGELAGVQPVSP